MNSEQWLGLVAGVLFGFLMQKGRVLRFEKQVGAMLLKDMTIFKFMLSAIIVGGLGLALFSGTLKPSHKPMNLGAVLLGGSLFGAGWAVAGFCPGTAAGALGEGRWHAFFAIVGMVAGAAVYAEIYPWLKKTVLSWKDFGRIGLTETLGVSAWTILPVFAVFCLALFFWFEKKRL